MVLTAGLAAAETISDALTDGPARTDRHYDHSLFVWFYVSGTGAGLLGLLLLRWLVGRWRGKASAAGSLAIGVGIALLIGVFLFWATVSLALIAD